MLILSRKVGEKIVIGDGITVVINRVAGDRVTIGLEAPPEVRILRGELRPYDEPVAESRRLPLGAIAESRHSRRFEAVLPGRPR